jgi:hypothetical protein
MSRGRRAPFSCRRRAPVPKPGMPQEPRSGAKRIMQRMAGILVDRRATARRRLAALRLQLGAPRAALGQWARCFRRGGRARCRGLFVSRRRRRATRPAAVPPRPHFFLETKKCTIHGGFLTGPSIKTFPCPGLVLAGGMFVKRRAGQKIHPGGQVRRRGRPSDFGTTRRGSWSDPPL